MLRKFNHQTLNIKSGRRGNIRGASSCRSWLEDGRFGSPGSMKNPSTYNKIAVASTFSPRFEQVLSEAKRIGDRFGSNLSLIYVGERNDETTKKFQSILGRLRLPTDSPVYYGSGDPGDGILRAISENNIDLI